MLLLIAAIAGLASPSYSKTGNQEQGIEGYVYRISGNQMPSVNRKPEKPKSISIKLYIFQSTNLNQVTRKGNSAFYSEIHSKLVKIIESDTSGHFKVSLPTGHYSIFTRHDQLYYANAFDSNNTIAPAEVQVGKITQLTVRIDYDAVY